MIITLTLEQENATDLGYLLHKHPDRLQSTELPAGTAWVCYPEATPQRCTAALIVEIDPIGLVRANRRSAGRANDAGALAQYVNDRPYAASSLLSGAIVKLFRTAMSGRCDARPELAASLLPLILEIPALPCRGGIDLARRIFEPLGWTIAAEPIALDPTMPEWGDSRYLSVRLSGQVRLAEAQPAVRPAARARRRQALLGEHRRGGQVDPGRRRLAGDPSGEGVDHPALSAASRLADRGGAGPAGRGRRPRAGAGRRCGRGA